MNDEVKKDLWKAKELLDEIYYATCKTEAAWFINKLTTMSLLIDELIDGE